MVKKLLKKFGYIHKDELIKQAVDIYLSHIGTYKDEKEFYFECGNCNALNGLFSRLGINLTEYVKRENIKRVYGGRERRTDDQRRSD